MKPLEILKTAITNSFRSKLRTSLTILAIFVGAFTLTITNGLGTGISNYIDTQVAAVGSSSTFTVAKTDTSGNPASGPKKYDPSTRVLAAGGRPGSTQQALGQADLTTIGTIPGITGVTPVTRLNPDYVQWNDGDKYQLSVSPLAGAQPQLAAGTALDDSGAQPQLILPASYVAPLGFADNNQAVGQDATIGITDATGTMHPITARITGIEQSALLGGGGAFVNKALSTALADAQGTGAPATTKTAWADCDSHLRPVLRRADQRHEKQARRTPDTPRRPSMTGSAPSRPSSTGSSASWTPSPSSP